MPKSPKPPTRARRKRHPGPKIKDWRPAYLGALILRCGHRTKAAADAQIAYVTVWEERQKNPAFAAEESKLVRVQTEQLEDEAFRRAYEGCAQVQYDKDGNVRSERTEFSDTLLLRILERRDPTWRQKSTVDVHSTQTFATKKERDAALEEARKHAAQPLD